MLFFQESCKFCASFQKFCFIFALLCMHNFVIFMPKNLPKFSPSPHDRSLDPPLIDSITADRMRFGTPGAPTSTYPPYALSLWRCHRCWWSHTRHWQGAFLKIDLISISRLGVDQLLLVPNANFLAKSPPPARMRAASPYRFLQSWVKSPAGRRGGGGLDKRLRYCKIFINSNVTVRAV